MKFKFRPRWFSILILAAGMLLFASNFRLVPALLIYDQGGRLLERRALSDATFIHCFVHSIHKTPVDELYRVEGKKLELETIKYDSYGVGMPTDEGQNFRIQDGRFVVDLHRSYERLDIRVSHVPGHGLVIGEQFLPFTTWVAIEDLLTLKAGRTLQLFQRR